MEGEPIAQHTEEAPAHAGPGGQPDFLNVSGPMMGLTWLTFILMAVVLYKVAWKPILANLEKREADIRKAVEEAEKIRQELARIEETRQGIIATADTKARDIVDTARQAAQEAAHVIENKAREESGILIANASREIRTLQEKAQAAIKRQTAELATELAGRILQEKLDTEKDRQLVDRLIKEI